MPQPSRQEQFCMQKKRETGLNLSGFGFTDQSLSYSCKEARVATLATS